MMKYCRLLRLVALHSNLSVVLGAAAEATGEIMFNDKIYGWPSKRPLDDAAHHRNGHLVQNGFPFGSHLDRQICYKTSTMIGTWQQSFSSFFILQEPRVVFKKRTHHHPILLRN